MKTYGMKLGFFLASVAFNEGTMAPLLDLPFLNQENLMGDSLKTYVND